MSGDGVFAIIANISQSHLVLTQRWGTLILYGVKPRTGFYGLQFTFGHGYPEFELIPLEDMTLGDSTKPEVVAIPASKLRSHPQAARADMFEVIRDSLRGTKAEVR